MKEIYTNYRYYRGDVCVCVCFHPIHSGHQVRWTYQPGSHRRKVTQDFSSTFFLRCVSSFFSREGDGVPIITKKVVIVIIYNNH